MNWEGNSPESLTNICCKTCLRNPSTFCEVDENGIPRRLKDYVILPKEICEKLFLKYTEYTGEKLNNQFAYLFSDTSATRLERIDISNSVITDSGLQVLLKHKITELSVNRCHQLSKFALTLLNEFGHHLTKIDFGYSFFMFPESVNLLVPKLFDDGCYEEKILSYRDQGYILNTTKLKFFKINQLYLPQETDYFSLLLKPMTNLSYLDLSECFLLGSLECICSMPNLKSLILFGVPYVEITIPNVCKVKSLRHLDISQKETKESDFAMPNFVLKQICTSLPLLESLDISGTNLAGVGVADMYNEERRKNAEIPQTDIPGLATRVTNPLKFLGLLDTSNDACHRHHIPAIHIAGCASEAQVLTAIKAYIDRPSFLKKALNELFRIFRYEMCKDQKTALRLILQGMRNHVKRKHIQMSGSASLFYIIKSEEGKYLNCKIRKEIVKVLLDAMTEHKNETTMIRNGCLTLCHFRIPQDVLFEYEKLVRILLYIVSEDDQDEFVQRIGIYLLNSLACLVEGNLKQLVGDLGAISTMLKLIEDRIFRSLCDDVMEIAWSAMWNVTDETPVNCQRFLDGGGMNLFLCCLGDFPNKAELLRNMMGLLGNVAEVKQLRRQLMKEEYLTVFSDLLDNNGDSIEVSYNAAGILSHIGSDGPEIWEEMNIAAPSRTDVLSRLYNAINRWSLTASRNINYRSFEPILRLVKCGCCLEAQLWAVWALANLTTLYPEKYCCLFEHEGGFLALGQLLNSSNPHLQTKVLAERVFENCRRYAEDELNCEQF